MNPTISIALYCQSWLQVARTTRITNVSQNMAWGGVGEEYGGITSGVPPPLIS